jgi:hypothetical protein
MRFPRRRKKSAVPVPDSLREARAQREEAERRLESARREVIAPLHAMREENHIGPLIGALIQRRARGGNGR